MEIDLQLLIGKIFQKAGAKQLAATTEHNKVTFGVKFPSAITEAIISIKTTTGALINDIIVKVDSGASVSLAHPEYLTDIKHCKLHGLSPVRLNGIGGKTEIMTQVGILNIITRNNKPVQIKCYAFNAAIGDTTRLCLLSNWAIDHYRINQPYHARTSLRVGPQKLRFLEAPKRARNTNLNLLHAEDTSPAVSAPAQPAIQIPVHAPEPTLGPAPKGAKGHQEESSSAFDLTEMEQTLDSLMILKNYIAQSPVLSATPTSGSSCNCELRYANTMMQETAERKSSGTTEIAAPQV